MQSTMDFNISGLDLYPLCVEFDYGQSIGHCINLIHTYCFDHFLVQKAVAAILFR